MSGQDVVRAKRESSEFNTTPRRGFPLDAVLAFIAIAAVVFCAIVGYNVLVLRVPLPSESSVVATDAAPSQWNKFNEATCQAQIREARAERVPQELMLADPAVTQGGYAALAARVACYASTNVARLCDPAEKSALVAMIVDYLGRRDLISLGLDVQGAPMKMMGSMMGGEAQFGSDVYDMTKDDTLAYMDMHHQRVASSLVALAQGGVLSSKDFGVFGYGAPATITDLLDDITMAKPICG